jgi:hypothetical protein
MHFFAYLHVLDRGHIDAAEESIDNAISLSSLVPAGLRGECHVEAAFFEAFDRRRPNVARDHLDRVSHRDPHVRQSDRLRAIAAIAVAEGRVAEAREYLDAARSHMCESSAFCASRLHEIDEACAS